MTNPVPGPLRSINHKMAAVGQRNVSAAKVRFRPTADFGIREWFNRELLLEQLSPDWPGRRAGPPVAEGHVPAASLSGITESL